MILDLFKKRNELSVIRNLSLHPTVKNFHPNEGGFCRYGGFAKRRRTGLGNRKMPSADFHDTARACFWLGYSLAGEWAEAIAAICLTIRNLAPCPRIEVIAKRKAVFAALLARTFHPDVGF